MTFQLAGSSITGVFLADIKIGLQVRQKHYINGAGSAVLQLYLFSLPLIDTIEVMTRTLMVDTQQLNTRILNVLK